MGGALCEIHLTYYCILFVGMRSTSTISTASHNRQHHSQNNHSVVMTAGFVGVVWNCNSMSMSGLRVGMCW